MPSISKLAPIPLILIIYAGNAMAEDPRTPNSMGNIINNQGIVTQGQIGSNTIVTPRRLAFSAKLGEAILSNMQRKKPIHLVGIGNTAADRLVAEQVFMFLRERGYEIPERSNIGVTSEMPERPVTIREEERQYILTIAPSVY